MKASRRALSDLSQQVLDALMDHICVLEKNGKIIAVNRAWEVFAAAHSAGTSANIGANYFAVCDAASGEDRGSAQEALKGLRAVAREEIAEYVLQYPCHSPDTKRWFEMRATRFTTGNRRGVVVAHTDITKRIQAGLALRESEERFRAIADYTADLECWFGPDGRLLWVNPAVERIAGYTAAECLSMPDFPLPLFPADDAGRSEASFRGALQGDRGNDWEFRFLRKDGVECWASASWQPIYSSDGRHMGHRTSVRDITQRKRAEEDLAQSRQALRALASRLEHEREESRKQVAREIHDELGHAMTDLKLDLAWLSQRLAKIGVTGHSAIRRRISRMSKQADIYARTVRRIATELRPAVLDALGLPAAIEWQTREFEQRSRIPCQLDLPESPPALTALQAIALFRVFQETLHNILEHAHATRVEVRLLTAGGCVVLKVRDNGQGFPPNLEFGPSALGMLGMRERIEALGGQLEVQSAPGEGATVTASVPLQPAGGLAL